MEKKKNYWFHWLKWGDWLLYGLIGGLAFVLLLWLPQRSGHAVTAAVLIQDGEVVLTIPAEQLHKGGETIIEANGFHYRIVYEDGRIRFSEADCPDLVCVRTGWISRYDQIAACVPGHLILKLEGEPDGTHNPDEPDVIVR